MPFDATKDQTITCQDCKQPFIFSVGEQTFFNTKGFDTPPKRCKPCRDAKKAEKEMAQQSQAQPQPQEDEGKGNRRGGGRGRRDDNQDYSKIWNRGRR